MGLISMYVVNMVLYMLAASPFYAAARILFLKKGKRTTKAGREIGLALFWLYMFGLASQTIIPKWHAGIDTAGGPYLHIITSNELASVNWVPFRTMQIYFGSNTGASDWGSLSLVNLLGNMLIFTPIGIGAPLLWRRMRTWWKIFLIGLGVTCLIETVQFFIGRSSDIDDVILNTIGVMIGYILFLFFRTERREAAS